MSRWAHAPCHIFINVGTYMFTGATLYKEHLFNSPQKLDLLQAIFFDLASRYDLRLEAWAFFSNHYHFIARSPNDPKDLVTFTNQFHSVSARDLNLLDNCAGREVWYQYWDKYISYQTSYLARLNYVMQNPVKHKLVDSADQYVWSSANWFMMNADPSRAKSVLSFKTDKIRIYDDF